MKSVVLLFQRKDSNDSEKFYNAEIENVSVTIEGVSNSVYTQGLKRSQIYNEACRFFATKNAHWNDNISWANFFKDKYALVIDFRTVDDEDVINTGRRLLGTQSGILLEIEKLATTHDIMCHVFVVSDTVIHIVNRKVQNVEY